MYKTKNKGIVEEPGKDMVSLLAGVSGHGWRQGCWIHNRCLPIPLSCHSKHESFRHLFPLSLGRTQNRGCAVCVCLCDWHAQESWHTSSHPHLQPCANPSQVRLRQLLPQSELAQEIPATCPLDLKASTELLRISPKTAANLTYPTFILFLDACFLCMQICTGHIFTSI